MMEGHDSSTEGFSQSAKNTINYLHQPNKHVEEAFQNVTNSLDVALSTMNMLNFFGKKEHKTLEILKSKWKTYFDKYVELAWESRTVAGTIRATAKDFCGSFLETIGNSNIPLPSRKEEAARFKETCDLQIKRAQNLSQGFKILCQDVTKFGQDIKEFFSRHQAVLKAEKTKVTREMDKMKERLERPWAVELNITPLDQFNRLQQREEGINYINELSSSIKSEVDLIQAELAVFEQIWATVSSDLVDIDTTFPIVANIVSEERLRRKSDEISATCGRLVDALREYETKISACETDCLSHRHDSQQMGRTQSSERGSSPTVFIDQSNEIVELRKTVQQLRDLNTQRKDEIVKLRDQLSSLQHIIYVHEKKDECETLFSQGNLYGAVQRLREVSNTAIEDQERNTSITHWLKAFTDRCLCKLRTIGDEASSKGKHDDVLKAYSALLSLVSSPPHTVLMTWASTVLIRSSVSKALDASAEFKVPQFQIYRAICDVLDGDDRIPQAIECFRKMQDMQLEVWTPDEVQWTVDFRQRCIEKLERQGDNALEVQNHGSAIGCYSSALSLEPTNIGSIILKCCRARVGQLEDELVNVTEAIDLDPLSYKGYRRKHDILHRMRRHREAFGAFKTMLANIEKSPDQLTHKLRSRYIDVTQLIREVVQQAIRDTPHVLIDVANGRLCGKAQQEAAFAKLSIYEELRSSMITPVRLNKSWIRREVEAFYQYAMLSHRWQPGEPTFQMVADTPIYELPTSPTKHKLVNFCHLVRSRRFRWAWSDTCCVNQANYVAHQESVVAMFRWYRGAAFTIVHLLGVLSESQRKGSLEKSIWNTRGWTYQEYIASEVIHFYTEDWKSYLGLDAMFNHKDSPFILSEMEQATKFGTEELATLQPGLDRVREKLYLASKRQTTREEDIAYSLLGIFDVSIPVIYGEGKKAVRNLLEHILQRSDDVTLLSWTGNLDSNGSNNSYLPCDLTVYDQVTPPHVPQPLGTVEMDRMIMGLQSSLPDFSVAVQLYERLHDLPSLSIVAGRLKLPGLVFHLADPVRLSESKSNSSCPVYHVTAPVLSDVRIETKDTLEGMQGLILIHPWISPLLDQDFSGGVSLYDQERRTLRLLVRLRQPFGGLLLSLQGRMRYKRVATDSLIMVQIRKEASLDDLIDSVRTVDVQ